MIEKLRNLNGMKLSENDAKMILLKNSKFRQELESAAFDSETYLIKIEYLDLLPGISYNIDFCKTSLFIRGDIYDLLYDIISNKDVWTDYIPDFPENLMQKMEVFRDMMGNVAGYSRQYYRLESRVTKLIEEFLEILEKHIKSIIDGIDEQYLIDDILNSCFDGAWVNTYINPETFEVYILEHQ